MLFLLLFLPFSAVANQQVAIDALAAQLRADAWPDCTAPSLATCGPSSLCAEPNCGSLRMFLNNAGAVVSLSVDASSLSAIPSEIGSLSTVTYLFWSPAGL